MHERALKIVYNDNVSSFEDWLQREQSVSIHHRNIRLLGIELYKTRNNISSHIIWVNYLNNEIYSTIFDHEQILQKNQIALLLMVWT